MEYLIMRGALKLNGHQPGPCLTGWVQEVNALLQDGEGARLTEHRLVIRYEGVIASSRELIPLLQQISRCLAEDVTVSVRRVRWETTLILRRRANNARRVPRQA